MLVVMMPHRSILLIRFPLMFQLMLNWLANTAPSIPTPKEKSLMICDISQPSHPSHALPRILCTIWILGAVCLLEFLMLGSKQKVGGYVARFQKPMVNQKCGIISHLHGVQHVLVGCQSIFSRSSSSLGPFLLQGVTHMKYDYDRNFDFEVLSCYKRHHEHPA